MSTCSEFLLLLLHVVKDKLSSDIFYFWHIEMQHIYYFQELYLRYTD